MNLEKLQEQLLAAARGDTPSDRVPYAFEQRILARLKDLPKPDKWAFWAGALWRAAAPCTAIMLLLAVWTWVSPVHPPASTAASTDLSQQIEQTLLAASDQDASADSTW